MLIAIEPKRIPSRSVDEVRVYVDYADDMPEDTRLFALCEGGRDDVAELWYHVSHGRDCTDQVARGQALIEAAAVATRIDRLDLITDYTVAVYPGPGADYLRAVVEHIANILVERDGCRRVIGENIEPVRLRVEDTDRTWAVVG